MRFTTTIFFMCALMGGTAIANNCVKGLYYCGSTLLRKGNYYNQIDAALIAESQSQDSNHINNSLFFCINDNNSNGNINFVQFCAKGCQDGGDGHNDFCK